jgi:hypothetical protein
LRNEWMNLWRRHTSSHTHSCVFVLSVTCTAVSWFLQHNTIERDDNNNN